MMALEYDGRLQTGLASSAVPNADSSAYFGDENHAVAFVSRMTLPLNDVYKPVKILVSANQLNLHDFEIRLPFVSIDKIPFKILRFVAITDRMNLDYRDTGCARFRQPVHKGVYQ